MSHSPRGRDTTRGAQAGFPASPGAGASLLVSASSLTGYLRAFRLACRNTRTVAGDTPALLQDILTYHGVMSSSQRRVLLAKPRGYCAGVDRAVQAVEMALDKFGPPVYVRRQIVHNTHVVSTLEKRGAIFVAEVDEVPPGAVVVFSAHGIAPEVRLDAERRGLHAIDATCPLVTKVHNEARRFAAKDYDILLVGHEGHEEVVGTAGEAPARVRLVDGADGAAEVEVRDPSKVVWLSQTTLSVDETVETVNALRERFPALLDPPSDDICYATQNRQAAVKVIADPGRPGARGGLAELLELRPAGRGGQGLRRPGRLPGRRRRRGRRALAGRRDDGRRDQRGLGTGGTGDRGAGQAGRPRVRRRGGSRGGGGAHDVRAPARAPSPPDAGPRRERAGPRHDG